MSKRHAIRLTVALGLTWSGTSLAAEGPMPAGTLAIGGEHLTGLFHTSISASANNVESDGSVTHFALLGMGSGAPAETPRIGLDGFVIDGLSLGGTLGIDHSSGDQNAAVGAGAITVSTSGSSSSTTLILAPRIGYAVMFTNSIGIWPRGGIVYYHSWISNEPIATPGTPRPSTDATLHFIGLGLDAPFIFAVSPGFAITAGPMMELAFDGGYSLDNPPAGTTVTSIDMSYTTFGLSVGLLGWM
jgi:hypothetical protein